MNRSIQQWRGMRPESVVAGSPAQVLFCIRDAQADILSLQAENEALRKSRDEWTNRAEVAMAQLVKLTIETAEKAIAQARKVEIPSDEFVEVVLGDACDGYGGGGGGRQTGFFPGGGGGGSVHE